MRQNEYITISGKKNGKRISSLELENAIQNAVKNGHRNIIVEAFGQHGIGGRLFRAGEERVKIIITGEAGQRAGSLGYPNTDIEIMESSSDDTGWLNAGARIVVHGNAGNGIANGMAQGKIYVAGNVGARCMTMTKRNPKFEPPELWVLGSAGDYFAEFMAGGICVICGYNPQDSQNVLGYRPMVGMVGGKVFFRGEHKGFSYDDTKIIPISEEDWIWLKENIVIFLENIHKKELLDIFTKRDDWRLIIARSPYEKSISDKKNMTSFRLDIWEKELGRGGIVGDLSNIEREPIPLITTGELRRFIPIWENKKYKAPCEDACPSGIPVQKRWELIRNGKIEEAVDYALLYTPFPASVCGYLCPNLCMSACVRKDNHMAPVDVKLLGKASIKADIPDMPSLKNKRIGIIGGGPAGISAGWQLRLKGYDAVIYDMAESLGGKLLSVIPETRIPKDVLDAEIEKIEKILTHVHLKENLDKEGFAELKKEFDFIIIATGAQKPIIPPFPGAEKAFSALDFLKKAKKENLDFCYEKKLVIIGAGNVGCDVATEAFRFGAIDVSLIDIQKPASFGKEREEAEKAGAKFMWPLFTKAITDKGVELVSGEVLPCDIVVISIGDAANADFLPASVDEYFQSADPKVFAIGDAVKTGLLTDAIGAGRKAARRIMDIIEKKETELEKNKAINKKRINTEYFNPKIISYKNEEDAALECISCGVCRDCGTCVEICPVSAIERKEFSDKEFQYISDGSRCIGCGFCAGACPCGIWTLIENTPLE